MTASAGSAPASLSAAVVVPLDTHPKAARYTVQRLHDAGISTVVVDADGDGEAAREVASLYRSGAISAGMGLGGPRGSAAVAHALQGLPIGVPKVLVTPQVSQAAAAADLVGVRDMIVVNPVGNLTMMDELARRVVGNAVAALAGMLRRPPQPETAGRPFRVALTMFGVTTPCVTRVRHHLDELGLEALVFAATGSGDRAMEDLVDQRFIDAVIDVTTSQVGQGLLRGNAPGGPRRLEIAGASGVPQVVAPGGLDIVICTAGDPLIGEGRRGLRAMHMHNPGTAVVRPTPAESARIGTEIARRLSLATGPTAMVIPRGGFSEYSAPGGPLFDRAADDAFIDAFTAAVSPAVRVLVIDASINDPVFADALTDCFLELGVDLPTSGRPADQVFARMRPPSSESGNPT